MSVPGKCVFAEDPSDTDLYGPCDGELVLVAGDHQVCWGHMDDWDEAEEDDDEDDDNEEDVP